MTVPYQPISDDELAELAKAPTQEATEEIEIDAPDDPDFEEVEETEVTGANFEEFLEEETPNLPALTGDGKLPPEAQAEYDEEPPAPQEGFEEGEGI